MNKNSNQLNSPQYDKSLLKSVGKNVFISASVEIRRPQLVSLGSNVDIDSGFYLTTQAELGDYIHIGPYVAVIGGKPGLLKMGNFTNVGAGAIILPGVTLRDGSVVGAGAVVTKDTEPWTIYAGSPARPVKKRPKETMLEYAAKLGYPNGRKT